MFHRLCYSVMTYESKEKAIENVVTPPFSSNLC